MNDFTKEELKEIQDCLPFSCNPQMGFVNKLFDKIQSMIDNYREKCGLGECNDYPEECLRRNK